MKPEALKICCEISLIPKAYKNGIFYEFEILYECDPNKNTECKKTICFMNGGECYLTEYIEFAKRKGHMIMAQFSPYTMQIKELAAEIERKKAAIHKTKSEHLRRDYGKSIKRSMADLKYYCRFRGIDYEDVIRRAEHDLS